LRVIAETGFANPDDHCQAGGKMMRLTQSYVHGASLTPLIGDTIGVHLDRMAGLSPDRLALVVRHQKIRWTYGEFRQKVDALAAGLVALGLKPGDRIGIWSQNNAEWVLTQFATAKAGLILVNIQSGLPPARAGVHHQ
jgi:fatty-acyl-CoA synthase